jgi:hypothetical protein
MYRYCLFTHNGISVKEHGKIESGILTGKKREDDRLMDW